MDNKFSLHENEDQSLFTSSATLGIRLALEAKGIKHKKIAVPANICPNVLLTILHTDNIPLFIDITTDDLCLSVKHLERMILEVNAVIAIHQYGSICEIEGIAQLCKRHAVFLIEDCAQALGATVNGHSVGTFGDVGVFSFGGGKIIDLEYGGLIFSNNFSLLNEIKSLTKHLSDWDNENHQLISDFSSLHTFSYNQFYPFREHNFSKYLYGFAKDLKDCYLCKSPIGLKEKVINQLPLLNMNINKRHKAALKFKNFCDQNGLRYHWPKQGSVFWRFNLLLEHNRDEIFKLLLSKKLPVSTWYPNIEPFFYETSKYSLPVTEKVGSQILNLWVNDEVDENYFKIVTKFILTSDSI